MRRFKQFSVRSLLVALTVLGLFFGGFSWRLRSARVQRRAIEKIEESSGRVFYSHQVLEGYGYTDAKLRVPEWLVRVAGVDFFATATAVEYQGSQIAADELAAVACLRNVETIVFRSCIFEDDLDLTDLCQLTELHTLDCSFTNVNDRHLKQLANVSHLRVLSLKATKISDTSLANLESMRRLEALGLSGTNISDKGMQYLAPLHKLEYLELAGTNITDDGLRILSDFKDIELLDLSGNELTDDGLRYLGGLHKLKVLLLKDTNIEGHGLRHLGSLASLEWLSLQNTRVDDSLPNYLGEDFGTLEILWLNDTNVSKSTVDALNVNLPNCQIYWDRPVVVPTENSTRGGIGEAGRLHGKSFGEQDFFEVGFVPGGV